MNSRKEAATQGQYTGFSIYSSVIQVNIRGIVGNEHTPFEVGEKKLWNL